MDVYAIVHEEVIKMYGFNALITVIRLLITSRFSNISQAAIPSHRTDI